MNNEKIIESIVDKINAGDDDYEIERFLERQEISSDEFESLIEMAKNKILEVQLKTYPKQNRLSFVIFVVLFILFILFCFLLPLLDIGSVMIPLSILVAIGTSLSGFYALLYYKSWKKDFIERKGKPKFDLHSYIMLATLPTVLLCYIISWNYLNGPGYNLYKMKSTFNFLKLFKH
jgi:hypothetical protein